MLVNLAFLENGYGGGRELFVVAEGIGSNIWPSSIVRLPTVHENPQNCDLWKGGHENVITIKKKLSAKLEVGHGIERMA